MRYAAIGETELASDWLEKDFQVGDKFLWIHDQMFEFDEMRKSPRFRAMLKRLNLPTTLRASGRRRRRTWTEMGRADLDRPTSGDASARPLPDLSASTDPDSEG